MSDVREAELWLASCLAAILAGDATDRLGLAKQYESPELLEAADLAAARCWRTLDLLDELKEIPE